MSGKEVGAAESKGTEETDAPVKIKEPSEASTPCVHGLVC